MSGQEIEVIEQHETSMTLVPDVTAQDLVRRLAVIRDAMHSAMEKDVDYGVIPGTNKPTLLKPGSEKLGVLFQLDIQIENEKMWEGEHLTVLSRATVFHAPTGARLGSGEGLCTTRESRYAWRTASRMCPACGVAAIIKGKQEYGGGWVCFKKKDGCGAKFEDGDTSIESQPTGRVANPDLPDAYNTVVKMAAKRARIDAVLAVTGASALFTQDVEDFAPDEPAASPQKPAQAATALLEPTWPGWLSRMEAVGVRDPQEWLQQATKELFAVPSLKELDSPQRADMLTRANKVLAALLDEDLSAAETTLGFVDDARVREAFAAVLGGVALDGPDPFEPTDADADEIPFGEDAAP